MKERGGARQRFGLRYQLPVYSPLPVRSLGAAIATASPERAAASLRDLLAKDFRAGEVLLCGSGTQALQLAIRIGLDRTGTEVAALPGFCCYDVATAAVGANARVHLYDLDPATLSPDVESLEGALQSGVRVVVVAHLYGMPIDWEALESLAREYGAVLIEDAAQGHGGYWRDKGVGSLGALGVLSFGRGKGWTGGAGGALLLRDGLEGSVLPVLLPSGARWKTPVSTAAQMILGRPSIYGLPASIPSLGLGETRYHVPGPPSRLAPFSAALALQTRAASETEGEARKAAARTMLEAIAPLRGIVPVEAIPGARPGYLRLPVRLRGGIDSFQNPGKALRLGIGRSYPTTLLALPEISSRLVDAGSDLPGATLLARDLITLPTHSLLREDERQSLLHLLSSLEAEVPARW